MRKVITYGTFDLFHKGHYNILKRAKEEGDYLIVGVTGENYDSERGKLSVQDSLTTRIENVRKTGFADLIIVEEYLGQKIQDIIKYDVDVLVIGSDWKGKFDHLSKYCEVKYLERTKNISSTKIREEEMTNYKFGIVTDTVYDGEAVMEPKHVSGIHLESVYSNDAKIAKDFCNKYELDSGYNNYNDFLNSIDIVYVKTKREDRYKYVKKALNNKKHVICDAPYSLEKKEIKELTELAEKNNVVLYNNITLLYLQAFGQLLWHARSNLIGDLISIKCSISKNEFDKERIMDFTDLAIYPICTIIKLLGTNYKETSCKLVKDDINNVIYSMLMFKYDNAVAIAEIGYDIELEGVMEIIGTNGSILIPHEWWKVGYFKRKSLNEKNYKRYTYNLEGNGFRYLVQDMMDLIRNSRNKSQRLKENELETTVEILSNIQNEILECNK
ncbi:Gfo/Idh/MocA family oxidoreductase [Anaerofustis stercorihominis]|uniref:Glycerol-3-phosphate cytidylyltransferase n=1 Tax=Anaerofustis stercorihominis DSM 17244 TaxID=445971 RepID=B1C6L8_9FIRM|nr:Gfo/Idh/MocA family oxidoreductase [Anaerofustis stercorihominis]EDS72655.1 putative glycerol-3-phosphate cytidylyltransferase [Anaerofustis stercorihominis DSM 17244]MCQ4794031.1 Gfo/Idh/MocA family oxidoreductase [Anaerofustis stercorihominis]